MKNQQIVNLLIVVTLIISKTKASIDEECEDLKIYNLPSTKINSKGQTTFDNFKDSLKDIKQGSDGKVFKIDFKEHLNLERVDKIDVKIIQTSSETVEAVEEEILRMKNLSGLSPYQKKIC